MNKAYGKKLSCSAYNRYLDAIRSEHGRHAYALEKGLEEGLTKGMAQGIAQGIAEGEKKRTKEIALSLLAAGVDEATITKSTGLSHEEIALLKKQ